MTPLERLEWLARNQVYTPPPLTEYPKRGPVFPLGYVIFFGVILAACVGAVSWVVWR